MCIYKRYTHIHICVYTTYVQICNIHYVYSHACIYKHYTHIHTCVCTTCTHICVYTNRAKPRPGCSKLLVNTRVSASTKRYEFVSYLCLFLISTYAVVTIHMWLHMLMLCLYLLQGFRAHKSILDFGLAVARTQNKICFIWLPTQKKWFRLHHDGTKDFFASSVQWS
jgi:hypothetical protein